MQRLGGEAVSAFNWLRHFSVCVKVIGKDVNIVGTCLAALRLDPRNLALDLRLDLVCHKVDGGVHIGSLFRCVYMQTFADNCHFAAVAKLVHGKHNAYLKTGRLAKKTPQLFHAASGILFKMVGGFKVFEGKRDVHIILLMMSVPGMENCGTRLLNDGGNLMNHLFYMYCLTRTAASAPCRRQD